MPYTREGGVKYSSHTVGSPLDNMGNTCMNCHKGTEKELKDTVERKLARKTELNTIAMDVIAKAHLEAGKAWELGATQDDMADILTDIRHAQWRWDYSIASHGSFFHAPEETLRILGSAINKGHEARLKLKVVLAKYNAAGYEAPDSPPRKKHRLSLTCPTKAGGRKDEFPENPEKKWVEEAKEKGIYDPKAWDGMEFKTSYSDM